jgi:ubiquinone/menaquinone biosynthesis C-methylase UbiE
MKKELIQILDCPLCQGGQKFIIKQEEGKDGEIYNGELKCPQCDKTYKIFNGVPRMVPENQKQMKSAQKGFGKLFRLWNSGRFGTEKLYGQSVSEEVLNFFQKLSISGEDLRGKTILDAGCGVGRLTERLSYYSPLMVVGIDIHNSMEQVCTRCKMLSNVYIIEGDLVQIPFREKQFDIIWCEGVLPYIYDHLGAFKQLIRILKPGGLIYIWVYSSHENSYNAKFASLFYNSHNYPHWLLLFISRFGGALFFMIDKFKQFMGKSPSLTTYQNRCFSLYDLLSQKFRKCFSKEEVVSWFEDNALKIIKTHTPGYGVTAVKKNK